MKYQANSTALSQSTDCLIIGIYENNELTKSFNEIDQITKGYLSQLAQSQDLSGKIGQATLLHSLPNLAAKRVLVAGCGKRGETTERQFKHGQGFLIHPGKLTFYQADSVNPWSYLWVGIGGNRGTRQRVKMNVKPDHRAAGTFIDINNRLNKRLLFLYQVTYF